MLLLFSASSRFKWSIYCHINQLPMFNAFHNSRRNYRHNNKAFSLCESTILYFCGLILPTRRLDPLTQRSWIQQFRQKTSLASWPYILFVSPCYCYIYIDHIINFHLMGLLLSFIWYQKWWRVTRIHFCIVWGSYWLSESFVSMWYLSGSLPRSLYVFSGGMFGVTLATLNLI